MPSGRKRSIQYDPAQLRQWIEVDGMVHREVAKAIGCAPQYLTEILRREGIASKPRGPRQGAGHGKWRGGRTLDRSGYVLVRVWDHPTATRNPSKHHRGAYIAEHRLVMEQHLGRPLLPAEVVHHKNGDKTDNCIENLQLFSSNGDHLKHELTGHCPQWSEDGKRRMQESCQRKKDRALAAKSDQQASLGDRLSSQTSGPTATSLDTADPAA